MWSEIQKHRIIIKYGFIAHRSAWMEVQEVSSSNIIKFNRKSKDFGIGSEGTRIRIWYLRVFQFTKLLGVFAMLHLKYGILRIFSITLKKLLRNYSSRGIREVKQIKFIWN